MSGSLLYLRFSYKLYSLGFYEYFTDHRRGFSFSSTNECIGVLQEYCPGV